MLAYRVEACAGQCDIRMPDLKGIVQSVNKADVLVIPDLTDPDSGEPVRRYVQALPDGSVLLVEQKHCSMYNLTVTLLLPDSISNNVVPQRLGSMLAEMPVWNRWFKKLDPKKILKAEFDSVRFKSHLTEAQSFSYSLDEKIFAEDEGSEVLLNYTHMDSGPLPFNTVISIYLGVGGM